MRLVRAVQSPVYRGVFGVMYGCGLRVSEAVALRTEDVDSRAMTLRVIGKGNKERLVLLTPELLADLRAVWATHRSRPWLFPNRTGTGHVDAHYVGRLLRRLRKELGLDPLLVPHSLRHGYGTRLLEQGVPIETVRLLMGHESIKTTQVYLHLTEAVRARTKQAVAAFHVPLFD